MGGLTLRAGEGCSCQNNSATPVKCQPDASGATAATDCHRRQCSECATSFSGRIAFPGHQCFRSLNDELDGCFLPTHLSCARHAHQGLPLGHFMFHALNRQFKDSAMRIVIHSQSLDSRVRVLITTDQQAVWAYHRGANGPSLLYGAVHGVVQSLVYPLNRSSSDKTRQGQDKRKKYYRVVECWWVKESVSWMGGAGASAVQCDVSGGRSVLVVPEEFLAGKDALYLVAVGLGPAPFVGSLVHYEASLRVDLFVFFSVFFASFFLALSVGGVGWALRSVWCRRLAERAEWSEMEALGTRPFAAVRVCLSERPEWEWESAAVQPSCVQFLRWSKVGVATVLVRLPAVRGGLGAASTLATLAKAPPSTSPSRRPPSAQPSHLTNPLQPTKVHPFASS